MVLWMPIKALRTLKIQQHYHEKIDTALERWMLEGEKRITDLVDETLGNYREFI